MAAWRDDDQTPGLLQVATQQQLVTHLYGRLDKICVDMYAEVCSQTLTVLQHRRKELIAHEVAVVVLSNSQERGSSTKT